MLEQSGQCSVGRSDARRRPSVIALLAALVTAIGCATAVELPDINDLDAGLTLGGSIGPKAPLGAGGSLGGQGGPPGTGGFSMPAASGGFPVGLGGVPMMSSGRSGAGGRMMGSSAGGMPISAAGGVPMRGSGGASSTGSVGVSGAAGSSGPVSCLMEQKLCGGVCAAPSPKVGCGPTGCDPCPGMPPTNGYLTCVSGACAFDCLSGYKKNNGACEGPPPGTSGGSCPTSPLGCPDCGAVFGPGCCNGSKCGCSPIPWTIGILGCI